MSPEDELQQFKKKTRRDNRIAIIIMGIAFAVSTLSMVYGVVKSIEANTQREACEAKLSELNMELHKCQSERK